MTKDFKRVLYRKNIKNSDPIWMCYTAGYRVDEFKSSKSKYRKIINLSLGILYTVFMIAYIISIPALVFVLITNGFTRNGPYDPIINMSMYYLMILSTLPLAYMSLLNVSGIKWALKNL